jgi:hypothetical protein
MTTEHEAAEAIADHVHQVGEACLRERRAPTAEEVERLAELEREYDEAIQREARIAAWVNPIFDRWNAEAAQSAMQYRRTLEGRIY